MTFVHLIFLFLTEALLNTFQNNLKFKTYVKKDPTAREYVACLKQIADMDHTKFDCFVCVILSHGCKGSVFGTDGEKVSIDALTGMYNKTLNGNENISPIFQNYTIEA